MNKTHPYTEGEIQAYCDGSFTGDPGAFKKQLETDAALQAEVELYRLIFHTIKQAKSPELAFDLSVAVLKKIPPERQQISRTVLWPVYLIGAVCLFVYFPFLVQYLSFETAEITIIAAIIVLVFVTGFHLAEYRRKSGFYRELL